MATVPYSPASAASLEMDARLAVELPLAELRALARQRRRHVLAFISARSGGKLLGMDDVAAVASVLHSMPRGRAVDLVLHSAGGSVPAAYRLGTLIQAHARELQVSVPQTARSAATIVCLAADRVLMGSAAELSPIDPTIYMTSSVEGEGLPARDVQAFGAMAENWFGLRSERSRLEALRILTSTVPARALAAAFRAEHYVQTVAMELMALSGVHKRGSVTRIVEKLMRGYAEHTHAIGPEAARKLGLPVQRMSKAEEALNHAVLAGCHVAMARCSNAESQIGGIVVASNAIAVYTRARSPKTETKAAAWQKGTWRLL